MKKLIILDPDLVGFGGHDFNYILGMVREAKARGIETRVFAHRSVDPAVVRELGAVAHFSTQGRAFVTDVSGPEAVRVAWTHVVVNATLSRDLAAITPELGPETMVFVPTTTSRQAAALAEWLAFIAPPSLPKLVCLLRHDIDSYPDERALLKFPVTVLATLRRPAGFCCETEASAAAHGSALGIPVTTIPLPFVVPAPDRPRIRQGDPPVVGSFGDARCGPRAVMDFLVAQHRSG